MNREAVGRGATSFAVFLSYAAVSFAFFGWRLFPHPGRLLVGAHEQNDAEIFVWSFAWWPHAILSWTNPFVSHVVYAPTGTNLAWVTSVPGIALAFSPVTLLFGPSVSYNLAAVLLPALAAWTAYLLCRSVTGSTWASVVGGYLFGFSSYIVAHQHAAHLNLVAVFLVPLVALVVLRYLREDLSALRLALGLGAILGLQLYISTEVALTLTLTLALGLLLALALVREVRPRIRSSLVPIAAGYVLGGLLAVPLLYYALTGHEHTTVYATQYKDDLLNLFVPTVVAGLGGQLLESLTSRFPGGTPERTAYLGLPVMLIAVLFVLRRRRMPTTRFLVAGFALATFISFGVALYAGGHRVVWLPWSATSGVPLLQDVVPSRFSIYAVLAVVPMVAIWIASTRGRFSSRPVVLPLLAMIALMPPVWRSEFVDHPPRWAFFSDGIYKICIPRDENLLVFPFGHWGDALLWQAESGFWFRMSEGTLGHSNQPADFVKDPTIYSLLMQSDRNASPSMDEILALAKRRRVDRVVSVAQNDPYPDGTDMHRFGPLQVIGDVFVAPACGYDSLAGDKRRP